MKEKQRYYRELCGNSYKTEYLDYIYVNELGDLIKPGYLTEEFPKFLVEHNMRRIKFHELRHSCATLMFQLKVPDKQVQEWLGHSTIGTTLNIYTHPDFESKVDSANAISSAIGI